MACLRACSLRAASRGGRSSLGTYFFIGILALAGSATVWAQAAASVSGRVSDATGASVPGASITVKNVETGATRVVATNDSGDYRAVSLPVGPQEIRVEKAGFKTAVRTGIDLVVAQEAVVNVTLEVGGIAETVTVSGEAPIVNTTTSSVSGLVSERQIRELPLNGRSFDNLITLNPGAISYALRSPGTTTLPSTPWRACASGTTLTLVTARLWRNPS